MNTREGSEMDVLMLKGSGWKVERHETGYSFILTTNVFQTASDAEIEATLGQTHDLVKVVSQTGSMENWVLSKEKQS